MLVKKMTYFTNYCSISLKIDLKKNCNEIKHLQDDIYGEMDEYKDNRSHQQHAKGPFWSFKEIFHSIKSPILPK